MTLTELNLFNKRITKRITHVNHTFISCDKVINKYQKKKKNLFKNKFIQLNPIQKKEIKNSNFERKSVS